MSDKKRDDSTQQLIASAEALRKDSDKGAKRAPSTRKLVRDSERLIGRESDRGGKGLWWLLGVSLVAIGAAAAYVFLRG